jgi:outer membrane protein assembly factor BamE (lipoprotein component of BamABCDE complex)
MENMLMEVYSSFGELATIFASMAKVMAKEPVQSLVEDVTLWSLSMYSDQTDDLHPMLRINSSQQEAVENVRMGIEDDTIYDILGRPVTDPSQHGVYIQNGQKIIR